MARTAALLYGIVCYVIFLGVFLYTVGFIGDFAVPKTIDSGGESPLAVALLVNAALLGLFGVQHSVMARPGFKRWFTRFVPRPIERSTYVLATNAVFVLLFWQWRAIPETVWQVEGLAGSVLFGLYFAGIATVLYATFLIDHFDLFGLRQVVLYFRGLPYSEKRFVTPGPYKHIRHPLYVGWLMTFWFTPHMTVGHLVFAVGASAYIFVAIVFEERDLMRYLGDEYRRYRESTPLMIPRLGGRPRPQTPAHETR